MLSFGMLLVKADPKLFCFLKLKFHYVGDVIMNEKQKQENARKL